MQRSGGVLQCSRRSTSQRIRSWTTLSRSVADWRCSTHQWLINAPVGSKSKVVFSQATSGFCISYVLPAASDQQLHGQR